jgi:hypothetical protein
MKKVPLPNPEGSVAFMDATIGRPYGDYDPNTNHCLGYCADVIRAGGGATPAEWSGPLTGFKQFQDITRGFDPVPPNRP